MKAVWLAAALGLAAAIPAAADDETKRTGFWTTGAASFSRDDNVFTLSPEDIEVQQSVDFHVPGPNRDRFWRMPYISDSIVRTFLGLYAQRHVTENKNAQRFGLDLEYHKYFHNTIKDHPSFSPFMRQYFGDRHYFEGRLNYVPDQFDLNYLGRAHRALRYPGFFTVLGAGLRWNGRLEKVPGLELGAHFDYAEEKYREVELNYRNAVIRRLGASTAYRWSPRLWFQGTYQFEQLNAARSVFNDRSAETHRWGLSAEILPAPGWRFVPGYQGSFTHYTTDFDLAADGFHAGRRDYLDTVSLLLGRRFSEKLDVWIKGEHSANRTNHSIQTSDERLRYVKTVLSMGAETSWEIPAIPRGGRVDERRRRELDRSGFWTKEGVVYAYHDNVHSLSPEDISSQQTIRNSATTPNHSRFNRIDHVDDHVLSYAISLFEQSAPFGSDYPERLGLELVYDKYHYNQIKDHSTLRSSLRQYLGARHFLEAFYTAAPNRFDRNYLGQDTPARYFAGNLDTHRYGLEWDGLLDAFGGVDAGLKYEYVRDHYREPELRYRSSIAHDYSLRLGYHWLDWVYTELRYAYARRFCAHSPVNDPSYYRHGWAARLEVKPWRALALEAQYAGSFTHFTSNQGNVDFFHAGRRDFLDEGFLKASYSLWDHLDFFGKYERAENRSNLPYGATDERLRYVKNIYSLGLETRWDLGQFSWAYGSQ